MRSAWLFMTVAGVITTTAAACGGGGGYSGSSNTQPAGAGATTPPTQAAASSPATEASPSAAVAASSLVKVGDTAKGKVLTDEKGLTLYIFKKDTPNSGKSTCNSGCEAAWPALKTTSATPPPTPAGATGTFSVITRDDGSKQLAFNGMPLYTYAQDKAPGDVTGDGVGNVWFVASANTQAAAAATPAAAGSSDTPYTNY